MDNDNDRKLNNNRFCGGWTVEGPGWVEDGKGTRTMDVLCSTSLLPLLFQMVQARDGPELDERLEQGEVVIAVVRK